MIDFKNASFVKLHEVPAEEGSKMVGDLLVEDEQIFNSFKGMRDMVVFTNRRIIAVNVQGLTGKKETIHLCLTAKYKHFHLSRLEYLTWMLS